jgi:hypothetical protein
VHNLYVRLQDDIQAENVQVFSGFYISDPQLVIIANVNFVAQCFSGYKLKLLFILRLVF